MWELQCVNKLAAWQTDRFPYKSDLKCLYKRVVEKSFSGCFCLAEAWMKAMAIQAKKIKNKLPSSCQHQENAEIVQNLDFSENRSSCLG